jgi:hypothetical protein|tara:strand:+ start:277 stop:783 length:507 start_codon:yes stop_codon:yes gene_type:complete
MSKTYNISSIALNKLLERIMNVVGHMNNDHIFTILMNDLSDHAKESIIHLAHMDEEYSPLQIGDYCVVKPLSYHVGSDFEWDVLDDLKLNPGNGLVYCIVKGDDNWSSSEEYNPFASRLKVELMYHDSDNNLKYVEQTFNPMELRRVDTDDIKYFDILDTDKPLIQNA